MRQNFPARIKVAAFKRAGGMCEYIRPDGHRCYGVLVPGRWRLDHINPDGLTGEPTIENGQCICLACDAEKTPQDQANIALAKRREAADIGAERPSARGFRKAEKPAKVSAKTPLPRRAIYVERT